MSKPSKTGFAALVVLAAVSALLVWGNAAPIAPGPPGKAPGGKLHIDFIDVGHGDSSLIISSTGKKVLIDGGLREKGPDLVAFLRSRDACPLDLILLTHRHVDHLGGLLDVVTSCGTRTYMDAPYPHDSPIYSRLLTLLEDRQIPVRQAERGRTIDLGNGARLTLLGPPTPPIRGTDSDVNANSVASRLEYGVSSVLFAADVNEATEAWLLDNGASLRSTVLKVAHHGSRHASTAAFLSAVMPKVAVISTEAGDAKHPHPETLARLAQVRASIFRTDQDQTITIDMDTKSMSIRGHVRMEEIKSQ